MWNFREVVGVWRECGSARVIGGGRKAGEVVMHVGE